MTTVARLNADLTADSARFEAGMRRSSTAMATAQKNWQSSLQRGERNFESLGNKVDSTTSVLLRLQTASAALFGGLALAAGAREVVNYADTYSQLESRLKLVSGSMAEVSQRQQDLFEIAQRTRQPLESVTNLYTRLNQAIPEGQRAQYDMLGVTESINMALAVTGEGSAQAASAVLQFAQAVQSDFKGSGEEINSLLDSAPRLAQAIQKSFGDGSKSLKQLAADGELSTKTILQSLAAMGQQGQALRAEFGQIGQTVGQSLTNLDNAFLNFIGQSETARKGSSSLAASIQSLADNFDKVASLGVGLAVILAARTIPALVAQATAFANNVIAQRAAALSALDVAKANQAGAIAAYNMARAQAVSYGTMGLVGPAAARAATATTALAAAQAEAARALSGALALFGGPLGLSIIAVSAAMIAFNSDTKETQKTQDKWKDVAAKFAENMESMKTASGSTREAIVADNDYMIQSAIKQMEVYAKQLEAITSQADNGMFGALAIGAKEVWTSLGGYGDRPSQVIKQFDAVTEALKAMREAAEKPSSSSGGGNGSIADASKKQLKEAEQRAKTVQGIIQGLEEESTKLNTQINLYGEKDSAVQRALRTQEIYTQLQREGITLTHDQSAAIEGYLANIEMQSEAYAKLEENQKALKQAEEDRREAIRDLAYQFTSGFEDAIVEGGKLSDVMKGLEKDLLRLALRTAVIGPSGTILGDLFSNFGGSIFSTFTSHATGIDYVPKDGNARIHRGEMILNAREAEEVRQGGFGGGGNVYITNNSSAKVSAAPADTGNGTDIQILVEETVARGVNRKGSPINKALTNYINQPLTRR